MSMIERLLSILCSIDVPYKEIWELTTWDRRFKGIEKMKQPKVVQFKHVSAARLKSLKKQNGTVRLLSTGRFEGWTSDNEEIDKQNIGEVITIPSGGSANVKYFKGKFIDSGNIIAVARDESVNLKYLYYWLINNVSKIESLFRGAGVKHPDMNELLKYSVPVPPILIQNEIVHILDLFTELDEILRQELKARTKQFRYYSDMLLNFKTNEVEWRLLGEVGEVCMCKRIYKRQTSRNEVVPFYKIGTFGKLADSYISEELFHEYRDKYSFPKVGDVLLSASGTIGRTIIYDGKPAYFQDSNIVWISNDEQLVTNKYLYHIYKKINWQTDNGGTISRLYNNSIRKTKIPVPSLAEQEVIVSILDSFDVLVNDITIGLPAEIEARRKQYEYYRNRLLSFKLVANG